MSIKFDLLGKTVWIPGGRGMVASALIRRLQREELSLLATSRQDVDLSSAEQVRAFYKKFQPDVVFLAAAKVGGIHANNSYPADFISENIIIQYNVIEHARQSGVKKLIFFGSSCIYPKACPQPIKEEFLLTGPLETTNQWYAMAKIAGVKMCQAYRKQYGCDFISVMPTNLYGPNDNFHPENGHVPPALLARFHRAKHNNAPTVQVWGTGAPRREFLHVDDLADAAVFLASHYSEEAPVNIGTGKDISIADFAALIKEITGYKGNIEFNSAHPDGTDRKLLDITKLRKLGWRHQISLFDGMTKYYQWYLNEICDEKK